MAHVLHSFWRRHRWTALRSLLLVALLHRLHFLAFLAASSPVWLLTAFLLGAVLVSSEPNVPLAAASEDEDRHLYKKIRRHQPVTGVSGSSSDDDNESSVTSMEDVEDVENHLVVDKAEEEEVVKAAVAWTADDEHSIQSIGSLELERDARLEKLMSRRTTHRNLIDLDVHIPAVMAPRTKNPFDLHHHSSSYYDDGHVTAAAAAMDAAPGSAPSSLLGQHTNPFDDIHIQQQRERDRDPDEEDTEDEKKAAMLRRHESFTAGAAPLARPSRFKPYFVADAAEGDGGGRGAGSDNSNSNSNSSSPSSSTASDHQTQQEAAVKVEEAPAASTSPCAWNGKGNGMVMAVDVELISDSSDDDMSLQGDDGGILNNARDHSDDDEEDSFEVESITQQVAAGKQQLQLPRVTAVVEPVSPPSEQEHRHQQQQHEDDDKKDAGIVSGSNESTLASVADNEKRERELTEIREHHILGAVPVIDSSGTSPGARVGGAGATVAAAPTPPATAASGPPPVGAPPQPAAAPTPRATAAAAPTPPAAAGPPPVATPPQPAAAAAAPTPRATAAVASAPPSGKLSSKSKVASKKIDPKKAVFGFFRK